MSTDECSHGVRWQLLCTDCGDAAVPWRHRLFVASIDLKVEQERVQRRNDDLGALHAAVAELTFGQTEMRKRMKSLFAAIKHGDEKHQQWLKQAIDDHFIFAFEDPVVAVVRDYREMVRNMIIGVHSLPPWTVERDWSWEVLSDRGAVIGKFKTKTEADDFVAFGEEIKAELDARSKELEVELAVVVDKERA